MKQIAMPNGDLVDFPDEMPPDQIKALIAKKFPNEVAGHLEQTASAVRARMPWSEVATKAVDNAPSSAGHFLSDLVQPILHPIDTAESIGNIGKGVLQKV